MPRYPARRTCCRALAQARFVAEVAMDRLDRSHAGGRRAEQAKAARQLVGEAVAAVSVAVVAGAERSREIFGAPGHRDHPRRAGIAAGREHALGRFGHEQRSPWSSRLLDAGGDFERRQVVVEQLDIGTAARLWAT